MTRTVTLTRRRFILLCIGLGCLVGAVIATLAPGLLPDDEIPSMVVRETELIRSVSAEGTLRAVTSTSLSAPRQVRQPLKIAWMVTDGSRVKKGDVVARFDAEELQRTLDDSRDDRMSANLKIEKERVEVSNAIRGRERAKELAKEELETTREFQKQDDEIFSRHQIIESAIDETVSTAEMEHADDARKIEKTRSKSKLELLGIEQRAADLIVGQTEEALEQLVVRAPHDGIVLFRGHSLNLQ